MQLLSCRISLGHLSIQSRNQNVRLKRSVVVSKRVRKIVHSAVEHRTRIFQNENQKILGLLLSEQNRLLQFEESVRYAKNLQDVLLTPESKLLEHVPQSFLLSQPRDILTGDFVWINKLHHKIVIAVGDCTGHGIPGALMSVLGVSLFNQIILEERTIDPSEILRKLDDRLFNALQGATLNRNSYDGMDVAVVVIDKNEHTVMFAGAKRNLMVMSGRQLSEIKGARFPIGGLRLENKRHYPAHILTCSPNDTFYLHTDGFVDQFGGPNDKKLGTKRFKKLIEIAHEERLYNQKVLFQELFNRWKSSTEQTDDATLLAFRC